MSGDLSEVPTLLYNAQDVKSQLCAKSGSIAIYTFKNITNKLFLPVKAVDPGLKLLECGPTLHQGSTESLKHLFLCFSRYQEPTSSVSPSFCI